MPPPGSLKVAAILSVVESYRRLHVRRTIAFPRFSRLADLRSGAFQTLLPLCGSPGIHGRKRTAY